MEKRIILTQSGETGGDETAPYDVTIEGVSTFGEFVDFLLKSRPYLRGFINGIEYCRGVLIGTIPDDLQNQRIFGLATASGGWGSMDYYLLFDDEDKRD